MQGRKLYSTPTNDQNIPCPDSCVDSTLCPYSCGGHNIYKIYPIPPSLSPLLMPEPPAASTSSSGSRSISTVLIIVITVLATSFLLVSYYVIIMKYCKRWNPFRQRRWQNTMNEEFVDENRGLEIDHPIWYINTIGLQASVINAIAVFRFKTGDNLIEGTECAICLNEFLNDETLRLLPKCNHAFHVPCIDTWLRSHTNCPVCRAGIVSNPLANPGSYSTSRANSISIVVPVVETSDGENSVTGDSNGSSSSEIQSSDTNIDDLTEFVGVDSHEATCIMGKGNEESKLGKIDNTIEDEKHGIESASAEMRRSVSVNSFVSAEISGSVECEPEQGSGEDGGGNSGIQRTNDRCGSSITESFCRRNLSR